MDGDPVTSASCNRQYTHPEPQNPHGVTVVWQVTNHSMFRSFLALLASRFRLERKVHL